MTNSIRTPRQGKSATSQRIARAVDDEEWQKFRLSLKGTTTKYKIAQLEQYWQTNHEWNVPGVHNGNDCDVCIRVDNYVKALCRGGQLVAGMTLDNLVYRTVQIKK